MSGHAHPPDFIMSRTNVEVRASGCIEVALLTESVIFYVAVAARLLVHARNERSPRIGKWHDQRSPK